jgi:hypothetical protein
MSDPVQLNHVDLKHIFAGLQEQMLAQLKSIRKVVAHAGTMGDEGEECWLKLFQAYLPKRYVAEKAMILDSAGQCSQQEDIVVFDRQYSPFLLHGDHAKYIPAESVYAVFEVKQDLTKEHIIYAGKKVASVRALTRTSAQIYHAAGKHDPKPHFSIIGGILCSESKWSPAFGDPFRDAIGSLQELERLDCGCCLSDGAFECEWETPIPGISVSPSDTALIYFFLRLLSKLQKLGTVPAIDIDAYAKCLL